jgi:hypothetical protein
MKQEQKKNEISWLEIKFIQFLAILAALSFRFASLDSKAESVKAK